MKRRHFLPFIPLIGIIWIFFIGPKYAKKYGYKDSIDYLFNNNGILLYTTMMVQFISWSFLFLGL